MQHGNNMSWKLVCYHSIHFKIWHSPGFASRCSDRSVVDNSSSTAYVTLFLGYWLCELTLRRSSLLAEWSDTNFSFADVFLTALETFVCLLSNEAGLGTKCCIVGIGLVIWISFKLPWRWIFILAWATKGARLYDLAASTEKKYILVEDARHKHVYIITD